MSTIDNTRLKQMSFFILLVGLGILIFSELQIFFSSFLGAVTFYVLMRNQMNKLVNQKRLRKAVAATILIVLSFLIVLVPMWIFITLLGHKLSSILQNSGQLVSFLKGIALKIQQQYNVEIWSTDNVNKAGSLVATTVPNILGATFNTISSLLIMYFILYFMLVSSKEMESWLYKYIPLRDENISWLGRDLHELVFNNAIGVPVIALLQGIVGLIGYLIFGVPDPWFWFVITCFASMIPFLGSALAYVPLGILLLIQGPTWKGIVIFVYGLGVIGLVDNVFRIVLQRKLGNLHPLITVFGVILGVKIFGFIGLIFGPILISLFLLLVRIYVNEFGVKSH